MDAMLSSMYRYGRSHRRLREMLDETVRAGKAVCAYCGEPIMPDENWDLGHADDRRFYNGPEHARCNRATQKRRLRHSREW